MTTTNSPLTAPVEFDPETGTHRARYDWASPVSLTTAIVEILAEVEDVDSREVGRLYEAIDPEALDVLFHPSPIAEARREGQVSFVVDEHRVTVHGTGDIEVEVPGRG